MANDSRLDRLDIAQWVGNLLWIIMLESHLLSRPFVFLVGPLVVLLCMFVIGSPIPFRRLQRASLIAVLLSVGGFLLTKYVFR
jgi:hypothetical protein